MSFPVDIWKTLAGVAIFMWGSRFMDESLRSLAGRKFKLFLKRQTVHKARAVAGGFLFSGLLQSSSLVNLLILSFAGAGIIQLSNALAVILGSNLGSTATNWIIASVGFGLELENLAFPLAAVTGILIIFLTPGTRPFHWCKLLFGFSLLFIGLGFIKTGMSGIMRHNSFAIIRDYPLTVFAAAGLLITGIIQSSAATMALALSSIYLHAITLPAAMALTLGSECGTSVKLFIASSKSGVVRKRIAWGNLLFNLLPAVIFLLLLHPTHLLITNAIGISNNLYALVFFQTLVNLAGILLFYPFLQYFSNWLIALIPGKRPYALAIHEKPVDASSPASDALAKDTGTFIRLTLQFIKMTVHLDEKISKHKTTDNFFGNSIEKNYVLLKNLHGELHGYYTDVVKNRMRPEQAERFVQLSSCIRNGLYAAKSIKDAIRDIEQLSASSNDAKYEFYLQARAKVSDFSDRALAILAGNGTVAALSIAGFYKEIQNSYNNSLGELYSTDLSSRLNEQEISTLMNFNREAYTAFKSILFALKNYLLEGEAAREFDKLPGFIH